jgi:hypothetical protein
MTVSTPTVSGQILTSAYVNNNINSGLVYITEAAFSTTALDGIFTSTYDNYRIVVNDVYITGVAGLIQFNYRDTANATVNLGNYQSSVLRFDTSSTAFNFGAAAQAQADTGVNVNTGVSDSGWFVMDVYGPRLARPTTSTMSGAGLITGVTMVQASQRYTASTAMAGIVFKTSLGTIAGGRVFVYGYRKA